MKKILSNIIATIGLVMLFFGGCAINDELGNFQPVGIGLSIVGVLLIFVVSRGDYVLD